MGPSPYLQIRRQDTEDDNWAGITEVERQMEHVLSVAGKATTYDIYRG